MGRFFEVMVLAGLLVGLVGCGTSDSGPAVGVNGSLTQMAGIASLDECPNGGVVLEHGVDADKSGVLDAGEVTKTYFVCHGTNGSDADAATEIVALRAELSSLKAAVELNTAKKSFPGFGTTSAGVLRGNALADYATKTVVDGKIAAQETTTQDWVSNTALNGYASESWVNGNSYGSAAAVALNTAKTSFPGFGMTRVPAGQFKYGPVDSPNNWTETKTLPTFYIDTHEVTAGEYKECVEAGGCGYGATGSEPAYGTSHTYNNNKDNHPINYVSWHEAVDYCTWKGKRLPTEVEWEKAARGTDGRTYPWGNESPACDYAVMNGCDGFTQPVGSEGSGKSPYGVYDMAGNLWEWTDSWYSSGSNYRVLRGGSFGNDEDDLRSSYRSLSSPANRNLTSGFRCSQ